MFKRIFGTTAAWNMTEALDSKDPQRVLNYMKDHHDQIVDDTNYIPLLVRALRDFQTNIEVNKEALNLINEEIGYAKAMPLVDHDRISTLQKDKGLEQVVENMYHFIEDPVIASLSLYILEASSKHDKICKGILSKTETLRTIVLVMTSHKKIYAKICERGLNIFLNVIEKNKDNTEISGNFASAGVITMLSLLVQNAAYNRKNPSVAIKVLSLLKLSAQAVKDYEDQVESALSEIFEGFKTFTGQKGDKKPQEFVNRESILYTLNFTAKAVSGSQNIQKHFTEKGYFNVLTGIILQSIDDKEILLSGSQSILSFNMNDKDVKKVAIESFFGLFYGIFSSPQLPPEVHAAYLQVLKSIVKNNVEFSEKVISSRILKKVFGIMEKNPDDKKIQEPGLEVISHSITCAPGSIEDSYGIDFGLICNLVEKNQKNEVLKSRALIMANALNRIKINNSNVITMVISLRLSVKLCDKPDSELEARFEEFGKMKGKILEKVGENGGVKVFVGTIKKFSGFTESRRIISSCLTVLARMLRLKKSTLKDFNSVGGVEVVLGAMKKYPEDWEIQTLCCKVFAGITSNRDCLTSFNYYKGIDLVLNALNRNVSHEKVQQCGSAVIAKYIHVLLFAEKLKKEDTFFAIIRALNNFPGNPKIQSYYCTYLSQIFDEKQKEFVVKYGCHKNVLRIFSEKKTKRLAKLGFQCYCTLLSKFGVVDIPGEEDLGASTILEYMGTIDITKSNAKGSDKDKGDASGELRMGFVAILMILRIRPNVKGYLNKESFVCCALNAFAVCVLDQQFTSLLEEIFSCIDFVQGRDIVNPENLKQNSSTLKNGRQKESLIEVCLAFLSKPTVLNNLVNSPQMEQTVVAVMEIVKNKNYSTSIHTHCFQALGLIGYMCGKNLRRLILKSDVVCALGQLSFKDPNRIESTFTFLLGMAKESYGTRDEMSKMYGKPIFDALNTKEVTDKAKILGYEIISELSMCLLSRKIVKKEDLFSALRFLVTNYENDVTFVKTSGILNLATVKRGGKGKLSETVCTMVLDPDDANVQRNGCKFILSEDSIDWTKGKTLKCGVVEALFLAMMTHRNDKDVIIDVCRTLAHIGKTGAETVGKFFCCVGLCKVLVSLLCVHSKAEEAVCSICEALCAAGRWAMVDLGEVRGRIQPSFLDDPRISQALSTLEELNKQHKKLKGKDCFDKTRFECAKEDKIVTIRTIDDLKKSDCEKITRWVNQLGVKNAEKVKESIVNYALDGAKLCELKSVEELIKCYGIPNEDAQVIFEFIQDLSSGGSGLMKLDRKLTHFDYTASGSDSSFANACEKAPPDFYETLEESLESAGFVNIKAMIKYSREMAVYLEKEGTLAKCGVTSADAVALMIYTYDNGAEHLESNPFRIVNKALGERNTQKLINMRGYILRLVSALRKLPPYDKAKTLYRSVTKVGEKSKKVGNILSWPAFTSTSADEGAVIGFNKDYEEEGEGKEEGRERDERCIFEIKGCFKKGHAINEFSFHQYEEEVLFEPDTQFKVFEVKPDPNIPGVTRICVEVLDTPQTLTEVVENFRKMCSKNADKENFTCDRYAERVKWVRSYEGPIVEKDGRNNFWEIVKSAAMKGEYMSVKEALFSMIGEDVLKEVVMGYKEDVIDDEYSEGADMRRGYQMSVEEGAAVYSCTYECGKSFGKTERLCLSSVVNELLGAWKSKGIDPPCANYLLHIASALEKLPMWGMMDVYNDDDEDGSGDRTTATKRKKKRIYLCMKEDAAEALIAGKEYVMGSLFVGFTEKPKASKGKCVMCIEDVRNLCVREVGPLSAWGKGGYLIGLPGARITIVSALNENKEIVVRGVPMSDEEKSAYSKCVEAFSERIPLPSGWVVDVDDDSGRLFYQNEDTEETRWARPEVEDPEFFTYFGSDKKRLTPLQPSTTQQQAKQSSRVSLTPQETETQQIQQFSYPLQTSSTSQPLPDNWVSRVDPKTGRTYYANTATKKTQWEFPREEGVLLGNSEIWATSASQTPMEQPMQCQQEQYPSIGVSGQFAQPSFSQQKQQSFSPNYNQPRNSQSPQYFQTQNSQSSQYNQPQNSQSSQYYQPQNLQSSQYFQTQNPQPSQYSQSLGSSQTSFTNHSPPLNNFYAPSNNPYTTMQPSYQSTCPTYLVPPIQQNNQLSPQIPHQLSPQMQLQPNPPSFPYQQPQQQQVPQNYAVNTMQSNPYDPPSYQSSYNQNPPRGRNRSVSSPTSPQFSQLPQPNRQIPQFQNASVSISQQLPPNWEKRIDSKSGRTYYANTATRQTQWEFPSY